MNNINNFIVNLMNPYGKTTSFCPSCKKILDTDVLEKDGSMFMQKKCSEHGFFEAKIAKYSWYYKGLNDYYNSLFTNNFFGDNQVQIYTSSITSRCNLSCPICFADSPHSKPEEISMDFFKEQLKKIKNRGIAVHFSGGEPTMREDLPEMIKLAVESGNKTAIFTNGVRIAKDLNYLKKLKESGLNLVYLWMDTIKNPAVYEKMRGENFIELKNKAVANIKSLKIPLRILTVVAKGINDADIGDMIEYAKKDESIHTLYLRGYNYIGSYGLSTNQEFLIDELVEHIANLSNNIFKLEDVYYYQKIILTLGAIAKIPTDCVSSASIYVPRGKEKPIRDILSPDKFSKVLDEFEKIWQEDKERARKYFLSECAKRLLTDLNLYRLYRAIKKTGAGSCGKPPYKNYLMLLMVAMSDINNYDIERVPQRCINRSLDQGIDNRIPRCREMLKLYRKKDTSSIR